MKRIILIALAGLLLPLASCRRTKPQSPSNRSERDTVALNLLEMNQRYVQAAGNELAFYVKDQDKPYVLDEMGYWYYIAKKGSTRPVTFMEQVQIRQQVYLLSDSTRLCKDEQLAITPGRKEVIDAVDMCMEYLHVGDSVSILAPWYLAYGQRGDEDILPYACVRIEVNIIE